MIKDKMANKFNKPDHLRLKVTWKKTIDVLGRKLKSTSRQRRPMRKMEKLKSLEY